MSELLDAVEANRARLRSGQMKDVRELARRWKVIVSQLRADYAQFARAYLAAKSSQTLTASWVTQLDATAQLLEHYENNLRQVSQLVGQRAAESASLAAAAGASDGQKLVSLASKVSVSPLIEPAAFTSATLSSGPLADLVAQRAPTSAAAVSDVLVSSVARGVAPATTARRVVAVANGEFEHAVMVVRTEQMRAYRQATATAFQMNDQVEGWVWSSRLSDRTCAACWAMEGTIHPVNETLNSHPNCMCVAVPTVDGTSDVPLADASFARMSSMTQMSVLGPAAYGAYVAGDLRISQMARRTVSPVWGPGLARARLDSVLGESKAGEYVAAARSGRTI